MSELARRLEALVEAIFFNVHFQVNREITTERLGVDFTVTAPTTGAKGVVEVKLYTSERPPFSLLSRTVERLERARALAGADHAILVTNVRIDDELKLSLAPTSRVIFYDKPVLDELVRGHPQQSAALYEIERELAALRREPEALPSPTGGSKGPDSGELIEELSRPDLEARSRAPQIVRNQGAELCEELRKIPSGRTAKVPYEGKRVSASRYFEIKCLEALTYALEGDLTSWHPEFHNDSKSSRYDAISKIISENLFWRTIVEDFSTRYVVFEFKNYKEKISQTQIFTTEKYLFRTALRATAIIISRHGPDKNATSACIGALRESGKLIINLTIGDVCQMLHDRDAGSEPSNRLSDILDNMLMKMER